MSTADLSSLQALLERSPHGKDPAAGPLVLSAPLHNHVRAFLRSHCEAGAEMLSNSSVPSMRLAESIARCHHEAWDGSGYPRGLKGLQIPITARIVAIVDTFDALTHDRSYACACSAGTACERILAAAGSRFDPSLSTIFARLSQRLTERFGSIDAALEAVVEPSQMSKARRRIDRVVINATQ